MQQTSAIYQELLSAYQDGTPNVKFETRLAIGDVSYDETLLASMTADYQIFSEESPSVGNCVSSELDVEMLKPSSDLPPQARLTPYVRLTDGIRYSEWIQKGVFYIDTREKLEDGSSVEKIRIHAYDDMLKAEQDYPESSLAWPARDIDVVREIARFIGVPLDPRTEPIINRGYLIEYPAGYTCRDVLGYIAAAYAGCFVMSDLGELRVITIYGIPKETRYLINSSGDAITFGGDRILV